MITDTTATRLRTIGFLALGILLLPFVLLYVACYLVGQLVWGGILRVWFWRAHASRGRRVLFVYSESPNWQAYIEQTILPRLGDRAVVLNWSERQLWRSTSPWEARFFHRFSGDRDFNPAAVIFCSRGRIRTVRFYRAFLDFKHGNDAPLRDAERELFTLTDASAT